VTNPGGHNYALFDPRHRIVWLQMKSFVISEMVSVKAIVKSAILAIATVAFFLVSDLALPQAAAAYPFGQPILRHPGSDWADCLCQLSPSRQARRSGSASITVLPDTVFEAIVKFLRHQRAAGGSRRFKRRSKRRCCTDVTGRPRLLLRIEF